MWCISFFDPDIFFFVVMYLFAFFYLFFICVFFLFFICFNFNNLLVSPFDVSTSSKKKKSLCTRGVSSGMDPKKRKEEAILIRIWV